MLERGDIVKTKDGREGLVTGTRRTTAGDQYFVRFGTEVFDAEDLTVVREVDASYRAYLIRCLQREIELLLNEFDGVNKDELTN